MIKVHSYQSDTKCKHIHMLCLTCVQLPIIVDGIHSSIDTQMLKPPHDLIVQFMALENGRNPDIGTLKK